MSDGVPPASPAALDALRRRLDGWARALGFEALGVTDVDAGPHRDYLAQWLAQGHHGSMLWMERHEALRSDPPGLLPGALRVISVRMNYRPRDDDPEAVLADPRKAYIARYALGRDYHKVLRPRLARLAERIEREAGGQHRALTDSAPLLEKAYGEKAGLGWIGKNTLLLNREAGSWFLLGEILSTLPLPIDDPSTGDPCGTCSRCLSACPTDAFRGPRQLDARRCLAYQTIENKGPIPEDLRRPLGNRIFGCDDCQLVCPFTKFSRPTEEGDFAPRHDFDRSELLELFRWDEATWSARTAGSPLRRPGFEGWQRNLAVGLGNAPFDPAIVAALRERMETASPMVREHLSWALAEQAAKAP